MPVAKKNEKNKKCVFKCKNIIIVVLFLAVIVLGNIAYIEHETGVKREAEIFIEMFSNTYDELDVKYENDLKTVYKTNEILLNETLPNFEEGTRDYILTSEKIQKNEELKYYLAILNHKSNAGYDAAKSAFFVDLIIVFILVCVGIIYCIKRKKA